jgi:hypothetical protein
MCGACRGFILMDEFTKTGTVTDYGSTKERGQYELSKSGRRCNSRASVDDSGISLPLRFQGEKFEPLSDVPAPFAFVVFNNEGSGDRREGGLILRRLLQTNDAL